MKIQDIPQIGKLGLTVTWPGRNGLIRRILVTPANPRNDRQLVVRDLLAQQTRRFDALTDASRTPGTWPPHGFQSSPSARPKRTADGSATVRPDQLQAGPPGPGAGGRAAGGAAVPGPGAPEPGHHQHRWRHRGEVDLPDAARVRTRCCGPARRRTRRFGRVVTTASSAPARRRPLGSADITALYVAEFGAVPVGKRLFVQASTMVDGFESLPRQFQARVPAA